MKHRRKFNADFKQETVRLVLEQDRSVPSLAKDLGIHENTIYRWVQEYQRDNEKAFPGSGNLKPDDDELRKAKRRISDLEEEVAILKKAMVIFAKPPK